MINEEQLKRALEIHQKTGGYLGEIILEQGYIKEENFAYAFTLQFGQDLRFINLQKYNIGPETLRLIPFEFMERYRVVPVNQFRDVLTVAIASPENLEDIVNKLYSIIDINLIEIGVTTHRQIFQVLAEYYYRYQRGED